jgi:hypothetical protein
MNSNGLYLARGLCVLARPSGEIWSGQPMPAGVVQRTRDAVTVPVMSSSSITKGCPTRRTKPRERALWGGRLMRGGGTYRWW